MLILTPTQQKIFDYLRTHKTPASAQYLAEYFMISYTTSLQTLRFWCQKKKPRQLRWGAKSCTRSPSSARLNVICPECDMPYVNKPRPYKKEWEQQKDRDEKKLRATRERARYHMDKNGTDNNKNGKADRREGKDIDHIQPLSKGGTNSKSNLRVVKPSTNRSFSRNSDKTVKKNGNS